MVLPFLFALDAFGQNRGFSDNREGYGSYRMMGQDPDRILEYGRDMMRYGFHERVKLRNPRSILGMAGI